jgi:Peptidase inhibitor I9
MLSLRPRHVALLGMATLALVLAGSASAVAAATRIPFPAGQPSVLSAADVERLAANANKRSIIIFKNQHPEAPPRLASGQRAQAVDADQAGVRSELAQLGTPDVKSFHIVNAVAATLSDDEITRLNANPSVQAVVPDVQRSFGPLD